jgi:hypothetical protein
MGTYGGVEVSWASCCLRDLALYYVGNADWQSHHVERATVGYYLKMQVEILRGDEKVA